MARRKQPEPADGDRVRRYRTTPDLIADALREEIQQGKPRPGEPLRQEEIAARFVVSRIPVREALRQLEAEGLLVVYPNRGAYVAQLSAADVQEITELRVLLEGDLISRSVRQMSASDLALMVSALQVAERGASRPDWSISDNAFHEALYAPARRPRQLLMVRTLRSTVERYQVAYRRLPDQRSSWLDDHRAIIEATRNRDAREARRALVSHIQRAGAFLIEQLGTA
jgi:DNA-binding GntR family transcriptional regulator